MSYLLQGNIFTNIVFLSALENEEMFVYTINDYQLHTMCLVYIYFFFVF